MISRKINSRIKKEETASENIRANHGYKTERKPYEIELPHAITLH